MLDVTSSEKLMWPLRETRGIRSLFRAIYLNLQVRIKTMGEARCTWRVHDVKKIRFASGVRQDHCDGGALDTHSSLLRKKTQK